MRTSTVLRSSICNARPFLFGIWACASLVIPASATVSIPVHLQSSEGSPDSLHSVIANIPSGHRLIAARLAPATAEARVVTFHTGAWSGYQVATVVLWASGNLEAQLLLETVPGGIPPVRPLREDSQQQDRRRQQLAAFVANPQELVARPEASATPPATGKAQRSGGFQPTSEPSLSGSPVRHLIVTTEALAPAFQELADYRTRRGLPSQVRTLEWIESRTRHGIDRAETLRNFLVEAYELWGLEWVLLGGDTDIVPVRYGRSAVYAGTTDEFSPTDLYYACLDGTWNDDGDHYWGEGGDGLNTPSEADIFPELYVGRAPVRNVLEAQLFVQKLKNFERPVRQDYQDKVVFLQEVLTPANWDSGQTWGFDGAPVGETMIRNSLPVSLTTTRLYDTYWLYPGSQRLSRAASLARLDEGAGLVNHLGHGYRYNMSVGDASIVNANADLLSNVDRTFLLLMANCAAAAFDYDCLAEHYLRNPAGGAAGVIGAARSVSAILAMFYNEALIRQLFEHNQTRLGMLLNSARLERTGLAQGDNHDRQVHFCLAALGDPAMRIYNQPVRTTQVAHTDTLVAGPDTLAVQVWADSTPLADATVCAFKEGEVYSVAQTDSLGTAFLPITAQTAGLLLLNVVGANTVTVADTIHVLPAQPALLRFVQWTADDDTLGNSWGNGDGRLDAGETVELTLEMENTGGTTATNIIGQVSSNDPEITVVSGQVSIDALTAGEKQSASEVFTIHIQPAVADGRHVELPLQMSADGGASWNDILPLDFCAPRLEVTQVDVQLLSKAAVPYHTASQQQVQIQVKNYGSGALPELTGTLTASLATATMTPPFDLDSTNGSGSGALLELTDAYGRTLALTVDFLPPAQPAAPTADPTFSASTMRLLWTPSTDSDLLGYHLFRAPEFGSFERLTTDIILHADYRDANAAANSRYVYYVVAVDSSYQWSTPSNTTLVNTTAAVFAGWPLQLDDPTSSSVAVGDIDGDSAQEVLVGADGLYAWHANGLEVADGDSIPATFGILSDLPGLMNASLALGEFNALPGLEIVAAPWLSNRMYVFDGQGHVLPGWPQEPLNGGNVGYWASPAVGDLDDDGSPEVVAISKDGWLYVWHYDGTPLVAETDGKVRYVGAWTQNTPALADLDANGDLEIIVATAPGSLLVVGPNGVDDPGWPVALNKVAKASPVVGDVDGDGFPEIVVTSQNDLLHVLRPDGSALPGFPVYAPCRAPDMGPSPALGDLDGDGKLEIVLPVVPANFALSELRVYDYQGNVTFSKPLGNYTQVSPVLADLDGDGGIDLVISSEAGVLYAWDTAGNDLAGFPIAIGDFVRGTPTYTDVDFDGIGDLVIAGWNRNVYIWRMTGAYRRDRAPWPTFHGDMQRRGVLAVDFPTNTIESVTPRKLEAWWSPNPFNPNVTLHLLVPGRSPMEVSVALFDIRGRRVRQLLQAPLPPGPHQLLWDGRDAQGRTLASGVYLYRIHLADDTRSGKITLLR